ncbi:MAG TPA: hypothetical protein VFO01_18375 [Trebonia sp.]|nr:hypothetical protein [Trebonia sp.]
MTQHESFPGRPRGRRARQDNGGPEWQGYDATPPDQREFPDLAPVRPRGARDRDARVQNQPGQTAQPGGYGSYPGGGQAQAGGSYPGGGYPGGYGGQGRGEQAPWPEQQEPKHQAQPAAPRPQEQRQQAEETPSWAEPDSVEAFSERWHQRGLDSRDEQRAGRRKRRRLLAAAGAVAALAIAVTIYLVSGGPGAANLGFGNFVTNFLPGELQQVPDPCTSIPSATLSQYLPGKTKQAAPPLNSGANTECTWTLDSPPTYRVLQVQLQAYSPSGLASGNGSATFAAEDAYQSFENGFLKPGPKSGQPPAAVTDLTGMPGASQTSAFQATEVFNRGGATMDVANVLVRYRNVIITVVVDGLNQSSGGKTYATSMSDLTAAANTVAKEMASQIAK